MSTPWSAIDFRAAFLGFPHHSLSIPRAPRPPSASFAVGMESFQVARRLLEDAPPDEEPSFASTTLTLRIAAIFIILAAGGLGAHGGTPTLYDRGCEVPELARSRRFVSSS